MDAIPRTPILEYEPVEVKWGTDRGKPEPGIMQIMKQGDKVHMVDFLCPCGCGYTVPTPVTEDPADKNAGVWIYTDSGHGPTLYPSIRWLCGCKAHFWIKQGKTEFCGDSGK
jgi:Family of unknown function (DUF6527)